MLVVSLIALTAVVAGIAGALVALAVRDDPADTPGAIASAGATTVTTTTPSGTDRSSGSGWPPIAARARRGVVEITVKRTVSVQGPPGTPDQTQEQVVFGSGFVIDGDGTIVTNAHVASDATAITVHFADGATAAGKLAGADPTTDLAVVRVTGAAAHLHPLAFGASTSLAPGEPVMAIGTPFGYAGSVSVGVISGLGREITSPNGYTLSDAIQTDAAVNHGNSGGPLVNDAGAVIGVNAQIVDSGVDANVGVAFAIPLDAGNRAVLEELRSTGRVSHAWLGIAGLTIDQSVAAAAGLKTTSGVLVTGVAESSPAARAGLVAGTRTLTLDVTTICVGGDAIVALDGNAVRSMNDLQNLQEQLRPGTRATFSIIRADGTATTVTVQLGTQPETPPDITGGCA